MLCKLLKNNNKRKISNDLLCSDRTLFDRLNVHSFTNYGYKNNINEEIGPAIKNSKGSENSEQEVGDDLRVCVLNLDFL